MNPQFPVYLPSKGRWDSRLTSRALEKIKVPYFIIVEEQEYKQYAAVIDRAKILILDPAYQDNFDPCDNFGKTRVMGPAPVRNFAWDHAIKSGAAWHWCMDDNIRHFSRLHNNEKIHMADGTMFRVLEDFCLRYKNIAMAGPNYDTFAHRKEQRPPYIMNTRIYSCQLIRSDVPFRWRSRYNDDTDLSLRMLKARWCTVLFNTLLQMKIATMLVKGGNTPMYQGKGRYDMAEALYRLHPDVTHITRKWGRFQHHVDYRPFTQKLVLRDGIEIKPGVDEYGMQKIPMLEAFAP